MPNYTFEDSETGEVETITLKMSELDDYKRDNPTKKQILSNPIPIGDPIKLGFTKPPSDFQKHVLGNIKRNNFGSNIGNGRWSVD